MPQPSRPPRAPSDLRFTGRRGLDELAAIFASAAPLTLASPAPERFRARLHRRWFGESCLLRLRTAPLQIRLAAAERGGAPGGTGDGVLFLGAQLRGRTTITQGGPAAVLEPGGLGCVSSERGFTAASEAAVDAALLLAPLRLLGRQGEAVVDRGYPVLAPSPIVHGTAAFLSRVAPAGHGAVPPGRSGAETELALLGLARSALAEHQRAARPLESRTQLVRHLAIDIIERHHREDSLTVRGIAARLNLSDRQLHRYFSDDAVSLAARLANRRVETATKLLAETDTSVAETAARAGFRSETAMRQHVRRRTGLGPAAYRREAREGTRPGHRP